MLTCSMRSMHMTCKARNARRCCMNSTMKSATLTDCFHFLHVVMLCRNTMHATQCCCALKIASTDHDVNEVYYVHTSTTSLTELSAQQHCATRNYPSNIRKGLNSRRCASQTNISMDKLGRADAEEAMAYKPRLLQFELISLHASGTYVH